MTDPAPSPDYRKCEFCGNDTPAQQVACWKCGLWKGHKYETVEQRPSKELPERLRDPMKVLDRGERMCALMDEINADCGSIRVAGRFVDMQDELARLRTALTGISTCSTCEACRGAATRALGESAPKPGECQPVFDRAGRCGTCTACGANFTCGAALGRGRSQPPGYCHGA